MYGFGFRTPSRIDFCDYLLIFPGIVEASYASYFRKREFAPLEGNNDLSKLKENRSSTRKNELWFCPVFHFQRLKIVVSRGWHSKIKVIEIFRGSFWRQLEVRWCARVHGSYNR